MGRNLRHLINIVHDFISRDTSLEILTEHSTVMNTKSAQSRLGFGIIAALVEFERDLIFGRIEAGL